MPGSEGEMMSDKEEHVNYLQERLTGLAPAEAGGGSSSIVVRLFLKAMNVKPLVGEKLDCSDSESDRDLAAAMQLSLEEPKAQEKTGSLAKISAILKDGTKAVLGKAEALVSYAANYNIDPVANKIADLLLNSDMDFDLTDEVEAAGVIKAAQDVISDMGE